jgi:LytS/YehU family sensor histidine kinase
LRRYLVNRSILQLILSGIAIAAAATVAGGIVMFLTPALEVRWSPETCIGMGIVMAFNALLHAAMGLVLKGFIAGYSGRRQQEALEKKSCAMELALLKSRINPHFLFNTINNIDVLIREDAAKASDYLNKLSHLMRFMLYETRAERIPLAKELAYIDEYLELQMLRTSNPSYASYTVYGDAGSRQIAPMVFIPFIENAFKHADNKHLEQAIVIRIAIEADRIVFECRNATGMSRLMPPENGVGGELIQKRLALLYPGRHTLETHHKDGAYEVRLTIDHEAH